VLRKFGKETMDGILLVVVLVVMVGLMFLSSRRQKRGQQEVADFRSNLKAGNEVMTGSGLIGIVESVDDDGTVVVVSEGTKSRWLADAITKRPERLATEVGQTDSEQVPVIEAENDSEVDADQVESKKESN
jgi:preprotein translocase subunit YajC